MPDKAEKDKNLIIKDINFYIDEHDFLPKSFVEMFLKFYGGNSLRRLTRRAQFLITTFENYRNKTQNILKAGRYNVKIVTLKSLFGWVKKNSLKKRRRIRKENPNKKDILRKSDSLISLCVEDKILTITSFKDNVIDKPKVKIFKKSSANSAQVEYIKQKLVLFSKGYLCATKDEMEKEKPENAKRESNGNNKAENKTVKKAKIDKNKNKTPKPKTKKKVEPKALKSRFLSHKKIRALIIESKGKNVEDTEIESLPFWVARKKSISAKKASPGADFEKLTYSNEKESVCNLVREKEVVYIVDMEGNSTEDVWIANTKKAAREKFRELSLALNKALAKQKEVNELSHWWEGRYLSRKILEKAGLFVANRTKLLNYEDFEALSRPLFLDQVETAVFNSGLFSFLDSAFELENGSKLNFSQFSQKYYAVRLMFEYGHVIGAMLGDFLEFYHFAENEEKPQKMTAVTFEIDAESAVYEKMAVKAQNNKIRAFVFQRDSPNILCLLGRNAKTEKDKMALSIPLKIMRQAMRGEQQSFGEQ